jgi:hypothetical protein
MLDRQAQPKNPGKIAYTLHTYFQGVKINNELFLGWERRILTLLPAKLINASSNSLLGKIVRFVNYLLPPGPNDPAVTPPPKPPATAALNVLPETVGVVDPKVSPDAGIGDPDTPGVKAFAWPLGPTPTVAVPGRPTLNGFPGLVTIVCPLPNDPID